MRSYFIFNNWAKEISNKFKDITEDILIWVYFKILMILMFKFTTEIIK